MSSSVSGQSSQHPSKSDIEIELKFTLGPDDTEKIKRHPLYRSSPQGRAVTRTLKSIYFDTPDRALEKDGLALRTRKVGARWIQTLKTDADPGVGLFQRTEIETQIGGEAPEIDRISNGVLRAKVEKIAAGGGLHPTITTDIRRTSKRVIAPDGSLVQIDLDVGSVKTPDAASAVREVELELIEGAAAALPAVAMTLLEGGVHLHLSLMSKAERGRRLLDKRGPEPVKADRPEIPEDATVESAFSFILMSCLSQILANEAASRDATDPEGVHQMRVGVRRLRSALTVFGKVIPDSQLLPLKEELKWLFSALGEVRDIDVFLTETLDLVAPSVADQDPAMVRLRKAAVGVQRKSYQRLRKVLDDQRYTRLILILSGWPASRSWRDQPVSEASVKLFEPIQVYAAEQLRKRHSRVLKRGRNLASLPVELRHELRLDVKKLRYTVDFYSSLFGRKRVKPYVKALAKVQETLGRLNDSATATHVLDRLAGHQGRSATPEDHRFSGYVLGWIENQARHELDGLEAEWDAFVGTKIFW